MEATIAALKPEDAIRALFLRAANIEPSFSWQSVYAEEHASKFTVAKSAGFDVLDDMLKGLQRSLDEGRTYREFAKELTPLLQAKGWWGRQLVTDPDTGELVPATLGSTRRLKLIFDTNLRVSYAAGHWAGFERGKKARPWLRYVSLLVGEDRRPEHLRRHNLCLPVDHPYWDKWGPPCGWGCKCTLQALSDRDVERMRDELKFDPPDDELLSWTNKRTGEIRMIPKGIDPGWDHNPGKAGFRAMDAAERLISAAPEMAAKANQDLRWLVKPIGEDFVRWFDQAAAGGRVDRSTVVAGFLDGPIIADLRARGIDPASGAITIDQAAVMHMMRDIKASAGKMPTPETLRQLPEILNAPKAVLFDKREPALIYVFDVSPDPRLGKLVVRVNYQTKAKPKGGASQKITTNAVRTATLVEARSLGDTSFYDLISGSL